MWRRQSAAHGRGIKGHRPAAPSSGPTRRTYGAPLKVGALAARRLAKRQLQDVARMLSETPTIKRCRSLVVIARPGLDEGALLGWYLKRFV